MNSYLSGLHSASGWILGAGLFIAFVAWLLRNRFEDFWGYVFGLGCFLIGMGLTV